MKYETSRKRSFDELRAEYAVAFARLSSAVGHLQSLSLQSPGNGNKELQQQAVARVREAELDYRERRNTLAELLK